MNRFYVDKTCVIGDKAVIHDAQDIRHLVKALRAGLKEKMFITDGEGQAYESEIESISKNKILLRILKVIKKIRRDEQKVRFSIACAIPKFAKFEDIVDKGTQLGADEIIPLLTERTLVEKDLFIKKEERLKKVMISAAKQSGVLFLPFLRGPVSYRDFITNAASYDLKLVPNLSKAGLNLKGAVSNFKGGRIAVMIGPEGDFTKQEISLAESRGFQGVCLGDAVLRVDTAAIAVLSFLRLFFEGPKGS